MQRPCTASAWGTKIVAIAVISAFSLTTATGCFSTYELAPEEFSKLQSVEEIPRTVTSIEGDQIVVDRDTALYLRSKGGRRYPVTSYNFKMTPSQVVASDRDTLMLTSEVESYEVDLLNTAGTVILIVGVVLVVGGLIGITVADSEGAF
jgi:hypothetical protein